MHATALYHQRTQAHGLISSLRTLRNQAHGSCVLVGVSFVQKILEYVQASSAIIEDVEQGCVRRTPSLPPQQPTDSGTTFARILCAFVECFDKREAAQQKLGISGTTLRSWLSGIPPAYTRSPLLAELMSVSPQVMRAAIELSWTIHLARKD